MSKKTRAALPPVFHARVTGSRGGMDGEPRLRGEIDADSRVVCSWEEDSWVGPMSFKWRDPAAGDAFSLEAERLSQDVSLPAVESLVYDLVDESSGRKAMCGRGIVLVPVDGSDDCVLIGAKWEAGNRTLRSWLAREWPGHRVLNKDLKRA